MGVTVFVTFAWLVSLIAWPLIIPGIIFMILYFLKRRSQEIQKKRGFILPLTAISLGEVFLFPIGWLVIILSSNLNHSEIFLEIMVFLSVLTLIIGIAMLIRCAVKASHNNKVKSKTLCISAILFIMGFLTTGSAASFIIAVTMLFVMR